MHDAIIVGIPVLAVLVNILLGQSDSRFFRSDIRELRSEIRSEIRELRSEMRQRFDRVDAELRYFHGTVGKLEARVDAIEKRG